MLKFGASLGVISNILGTVFCGVSAWYAMATFYGWNRPTVAVTQSPNNLVASAPNIPFNLIVSLAAVGLALLIPSWIAVFRSLSRRSSGPPPFQAANAPEDARVSKTNLAAHELMVLCSGRTDVEVKHIVQEHLGKELADITGVVFNVSTYRDGSASIALDPEPDRSGLIHARIRGNDQVQRAAALRKGDRIRLKGKIDQIARD